MTQPADTFSSYDAVGNREDLSDIIYDISPTQTPFISGIPHVSATGHNHEWQTDSLAPAADNKVIQGDDATTDASAATVRLGNYCQISDKVARVTGTQRSMDAAGKGDELDYQVMKKSKELKRDQEFALVGQSNAKVVGSDSVAAELGSVHAYIATNDSFGATGVSPAGTGADTRTDGTQRPFTEELLKGVLADCWDAGGEPDLIMLGSFNKQAMSAFTGNATREVNAADKRLTAAIDVYVSDFGEITVIPNRFMRSRDGLVIEKDKWALASLRSFSETPLAKTGDSDRVQILCEYTLESRNEAASGGIFDLTTA